MSTINIYCKNIVSIKTSHNPYILHVEVESVDTEDLFEEVTDKMTTKDVLDRYDDDVLLEHLGIDKIERFMKEYHEFLKGE